MAPQRNVEFLSQCVRRLPAVNFADRDSGRIYLRTERGKVVWQDPPILAAALADPETRAGLEAVAAQAISATAAPAPGEPRRLTDIESVHTLGSWGGTRSTG